MPRLCARTDCSAPATATFTFDGLRRIVWLAPLADAGTPSAGVLCRRHTERFTAPRSWELRDLRPSAARGARPTGASAAPSRFAAPGRAASPTLPFERPVPRRAPRPLLGQRHEDEVAATPTANSP